jgi:hypothetical protein
MRMGSGAGKHRLSLRTVELPSAAVDEASSVDPNPIHPATQRALRRI